MKNSKSLKFVFILFQIVYACVVKQQTQKGSWDSQVIPRKTRGSCSCGRENFTYWGVEIIATLSNNAKVNCIGSIITSNLIATSHSCLSWRNSSFIRKLSLVEMWNPKYVIGDVIKPEDLDVLSLIKDQKIAVDRIIYHPRYIEGLQAHDSGFFDHDIALLRIKAGDPIISEITGEKGTKPVCIPTIDEVTQTVNAMPNYFGLQIYQEVSFFRISPGSDCSENIQLNGSLTRPGQNTFCMKYKILGPESEGVPVYVKDKSGVSYLSGITSWKDKKPSKFFSGSMKFVYITHALDFVKYVEQQAGLHGSIWCKKNKANFAKKAPQEVFRGNEEWHTKKIDIKSTLDCVCGHSNTETGRILGGVEATPNEFGWLVNLIVETKVGGLQCGGSIINDKTILTAAHCVIDIETLGLYPLEKYAIYATAHNVQNLGKEAKLLKAAAIYIHPAYTEIERYEYEFDFDVAVIILQEKLQFSKPGKQNKNSIVPICLPKITKPINVDGKNATVAGWGRNDTNTKNDKAPFHNTLQKLSKRILSLDECKSHVHPDTRLSDNYICGSVGKESGPGEGDSGGPLIISEPIPGLNNPPKESRREKITDIAAFYTNVQKHLSFINYYSNKHDASWCKFE